MNELKPEDVMRALECCTTDAIILGVPCRNCPYNECNIVGGQGKRKKSGTCRSWLMKDALALLREKDAEIERLKGALKAEERHNELAMECAKKALAKAKADTVRKMQEQIKAEIDRFDKRGGSAFINKDVIFWFIDQIAKEMLEGV